jgi:hypothetical protein
MAPSHAVIHGTLKPDGTLELEGRPALPPGPVEVIIRTLPQGGTTKEDWFQYLQRARAELEAAGCRFATAEEIHAYLDDLRSGDERIEEAYRQAEEEACRAGDK